MRPLVRRSLGAVAVLASVGTAFTAGVVAGSGTHPSPGAPAGASTLDEAASRIEGQALHPVRREALDAAAIAAMLRAAGDQWGTWSADGPSPNSSAAYGGVGVRLRTDARGAVVVAQVTPSSGAGRGGVRPGDEIRAVGERSTVGVSASAAAAALRGPSGSAVTVVLRRGAALRTVRLTRASVPAARVGVAVQPAGSGQPVGRITVPAFTSGVGHEVREGLETLRAAHATGVVLDLRGDPGGRLDEAVETASAFLDGGQVVSYLRRDGRPQRLDAVGQGDTATPLVVLVDGGTASAAEVVAGALQDRGRAVLVGTRTFGKGTVQEPARLSDGSQLELTVARYTTPGGRSPEGVGLEPDIGVAPGSPPEVALHRGVEVLVGLLADAAGASGGRG